VEDVCQLAAAATPHFALQLRKRLASLTAQLPSSHPVRQEAERQMLRLEQLGLEGENRGQAAHTDERALPSLRAL
jgi:hypothetical protein